MPWRVAGSLEVLRKQFNAAYPNRSKASDGGIGDLRHQASKSSDHNPHIKDANGVGVVTARDFTHDPANGIDCNELAKTLVKNRDPRIKYIIWSRRILSSKTSPWVWRPYSGVNAHTKHLHLSVIGEPKLYDSILPWDLDDDVAKIADDDNDILELKSSAATSMPAPHFTPENEQDALASDLKLSQTAASESLPPIAEPTVVNLPPDPPISTVVEKTVVEEVPGSMVSTVTTASSVPDPVEVKKESPSWFVKVAAPFTALTGIGINAGSFIQTKLEQMTPQQIGYMVAALGLVALAIFWWQKSAKAAQARTLAMVDTASDQQKTTVVLVK